MSRAEYLVRIGELLLAAIVLLVASFSPLFGQQAGSLGEDTEAGTLQSPLRTNEQLLDRAFQLTKAARTEDDYRDIIKMCEQAQRGRLSSARADYARRLMSWSYNRHGKLIASKATKLPATATADERQQMEERALAHFNTATKLDSKNWRAIHNRGVSYALASDLKRALADFDRTLKLRPEYANAWFNRAEIFFELGDQKSALHDYNEVVRLQPTDAGALNSRGHAHYRLRQYAEALTDYNKAIELEPKNSGAYSDRADLHADLGKWGRAAEDYRQAIVLDNSLGRAYQGAAWLMSTCPDGRYRNSNPVIAVAAAQKAIDLDGDDDYRYLDTLAAAQANASQFAEARRTLKMAIAGAPQKAVFRLQRRLALYEQETPFRESPRTAAAETALNR